MDRTLGLAIATEIDSTLIVLIAMAGAAALFFGWVVVAYNRLVRHKNRLKEGWSGIDVQLKRRHDLIPNLVETVKGYADFERSVLDDLTRLRTRAQQDDDDSQQVENQISSRLRTLFAVAENYPQLQANQGFLDLQSQLGDVEDHLQKARRYYNGTTRDYNIRVQSFPSNVVASLFRFEPAEFFEVESAIERATPKVEFE
ncbi:MAG: LemA family protein [Planctomycetes bacterium]|nr:LemA family protein [Planctomycetota bacterium]